MAVRIARNRETVVLSEFLTQAAGNSEKRLRDYRRLELYLEVFLGASISLIFFTLPLSERRLFTDGFFLRLGPRSSRPSYVVRRSFVSPDSVRVATNLRGPALAISAAPPLPFAAPIFVGPTRFSAGDPRELLGRAPFAERSGRLDPVVSNFDLPDFARPLVGRV